MVCLSVSVAFWKICFLIGQTRNLAEVELVSDRLQIRGTLGCFLNLSLLVWQINKQFPGWHLSSLSLWQGGRSIKTQPEHQSIKEERFNKCIKAMHLIMPSDSRRKLIQREEGRDGLAHFYQLHLVSRSGCYGARCVCWQHHVDDTCLLNHMLSCVVQRDLNERWVTFHTQWSGFWSRTVS